MESSTALLNYSIYSNTLEDLPKSNKLLINTINQYSFCIAENDSEFKKALEESNILVPDGVAIVWAVKLLTGKKIKKIAGADIHQHFLNEINIKGGKCFYLGASEDTLAKIRDRILDEFPNIKVASYSPPFKQEFSDSDIKEMIEAVNNFSPDVLFVGMTAPKQEKWVNKYSDQLNAKTICSIGAVFDFYAGTVERPHSFWIALGLEWFIRLIKEPKRLWKRYLYYGPIYILFILRAKIK